MLLCTPEWGTTGKNAYWRRPLDRMTVGKSELPNDQTWVPGDSQKTSSAPEWASFFRNWKSSQNNFQVRLD